MHLLEDEFMHHYKELQEFMTILSCVAFEELNPENAVNKD